MIILGIDPGYATTGVSLVEKLGAKLRLITYGTILTKPKLDFADRLLHLSNELKTLIIQHKPDTLAIEDLFFNTNTKTAIKVAQARGVVILTAKQCGLSVFNYTPLQIKISVSGYGRADKRQVQEMVKRLLNLDHIPKPDDAADALAVAICHAQSHRIQMLQETVK